ncbi:unnamed protein product [Enterobius vermicularis]|uniref:Uncharacterized protein n=1 Tax=Enterobius vermicularis TaxID=51028 RepID=A0A0N4VN92_ENTVE|nr:unnamed protein product [Enterobius vermicularis]
MAEQQQQQQSQQQQNRRPSGRMGRRFTLNPLIFAKEERDARRQSLAQLKLSYYPQNAHLTKVIEIIEEVVPTFRATIEQKASTKFRRVIN